MGTRNARSPRSGRLSNKRQPLQLFPPLDSTVEAALRASIERHGVLVPVVRDQHGRVLDGHHRSRLAADLGVACPAQQVYVDDDDHAAEIAVTLNLARRHLDAEQRRMVVADLRVQGHSQRAIAQAVGVSQKQVVRDLASPQVSPTTHLPERTTGRDGRSYPATRPARTVEPGDLVADDDGEVLAVVEVERDGDLTILHADDDQAIIVGIDEPVAVAPPKRLPTKPDLGGGISHPARYPVSLLPILAAAVPPERYASVLDPFAGTGRIHELPNRTVGVELEPEWARLAEGTIVGDALSLPFPANAFDAVVTSPAYGNRLADHHNARDASLRRTYTHDLGRALHANNSGAMAWGSRYRGFHEMAWAEIVRVLRPDGRLVLNVKDHAVRGARMFVAAWHVHTLIDLGLALRWSDQLDTGGLGQGANTSDAYPEQVFVFDKAER